MKKTHHWDALVACGIAVGIVIGVGSLAGLGVSIATKKIWGL